MALETIAVGEDLRVSRKGDPFDVLVEVVDGKEGFLREAIGEAAQGGQRLVPGQSLVIEPREAADEFLRAVDQALTVQVTPLRAKSSPEDVRKVSFQNGKQEVGPLARVLNQNPGANTDILSTDVAPPATGTLIIHVVLGAAAAFNAQVDVDGTIIESGANSGASLTADEGYTLELPCRGDATYNFQVESNVQVNLLQVDYSREAP